MQVQKTNNQSFGMRYIKVDDSVEGLGKNVVRAVENSIQRIKTDVGGDDTDLFIHARGIDPKKLFFEVSNILSVPKPKLFGGTKIVDQVYAQASETLDVKNLSELFDGSKLYEAAQRAVRKLEDAVEVKKSMEKIKMLCEKMNNEVK